MYVKWMATSLLALGVASTVTAQTKDTAKIPKDNPGREESIIIRKKGDNNEKMTIVVDGDNITVNGKDIKDLKDANVEVLRGNEHDLAIAPRIREIRRLHGPMEPMEGPHILMHSNRAVLGVLSEKHEKGAKVTEVNKESAAAKAGLQKDDIITKVGDTKIEDAESLYNTIGKYKPEDKVSITYLRNGKESITTAVLGKNKSSEARVFHFNDDFNRDFNQNFNFKMPRMRDMDGMEFSYDRKPKLGLQIQELDNGKGVKVMDVDEEAPAAKAGIRKDDVITAIDGKEIISVDNIRAKVRELKEGDSVKLTYQRDGKTQTAEIRFPKKLKTADL